MKGSYFDPSPSFERTRASTSCLRASLAKIFGSAGPFAATVLMALQSPAAQFGAAQTNLDTLSDIRGPIEIPSIWSWLLPVLIAAALGVLAWVWWILRKRRRTTAQIQETAADRARMRLREAWKCVDRPERFCTRLSEIVRVYLEERFRLRAPEQTTEEFLADTQKNTLLDLRHQGLLAQFLEQCDLVKFAGQEPGRKDLEHLHDAATNFIEETGYELPTLERALVQKVEAP